MKKLATSLLLVIISALYIAGCSTQEGVKSAYTNKEAQWQQSQGERAFKQLDNDAKTAE